MPTTKNGACARTRSSETCMKSSAGLIEANRCSVICQDTCPHRPQSDLLATPAQKFSGLDTNGLRIVLNHALWVCSHRFYQGGVFFAKGRNYHVACWLTQEFCLPLEGDNIPSLLYSIPGKREMCIPLHMY